MNHKNLLLSTAFSPQLGGICTHVHRSALTQRPGGLPPELSRAPSLHNLRISTVSPIILALVEPLDAKLSPAGPGLPLPVLSWRLWAIDARGSPHRDDCPVPCCAAAETYSLAHLFAFLLFVSGCEIQSVSPHYGYKLGLTPHFFFLKPCILIQFSTNPKCTSPMDFNGPHLRSTEL